ncbi:class I adenylate-forming enzyme family protein [uncultured Desulfovibrio sp.]|uniref:class I adenylate-forming enzyme family protein n=1 Tax=uncultured Desulfovibrio sp. TaxID=167968 RepID=UPI00262C7401|nr:class I adenylate-forming enzyme family protein [uncultured Desulfovibrio sp.]
MTRLFVEQVLQRCRQHPEQLALFHVAEEEQVTYAALYRRVAGVRANLQKAGISKGDAVILAASRSFDFIYLYLALHSLGAVTVPLDPRTPESRYTTIVRLVQPGLCAWPDGSMPGSVPLSEFREESVEEIPAPAPEPTDCADIMFTSGTTGVPKGVLLTHSNLRAAIQNINGYIGNTADDVEICPMPLSHSFGLARLRCALHAGGTILFEDGITKPRRLFDAMEKMRVTGIGMVGPAWVMLHRLSGDRIGRFREQLRYVELGSAPLSPEAKQHLAGLLPRTHVCMHYGLTEASRAAFLDFHADGKHIASVGKASPLSEIAIFSSDGRRLAAGERGEVCVRGEMVCNGYLDASQNKTAFFDGDFFRTGDEGSLDEEGYLYLHGRLKELINVGGEKVAPVDVEQLLDAMPGVQESACVGMPDPVLGETVAAFIVPEETTKPDTETLLTALKKELEPYKVPRRIIVTDHLPRTLSGKIKRIELKELL